MAEKKETTVQKTAEETVTIKLPREHGAEDAVVWVNERRFLIKRGVAVEVPVCVAEVLERQEQMLEYAYEFEQGLNK